MTVSDFLKLLGFPEGALLDLLRIVALKVPEVAAQVEELIAKLGEPLTAENLALVLSVVPKELLNILSGKLDPKPHPSDGA